MGAVNASVSLWILQYSEVPEAARVVQFGPVSFPALLKTSSLSPCQTAWLINRINKIEMQQTCPTAFCFTARRRLVWLLFLCHKLTHVFVAPQGSSRNLTAGHRECGEMKLLALHARRRGDCWQVEPSTRNEIFPMLQMQENHDESMPFEHNKLSDAKSRALQR